MKKIPNPGTIIVSVRTGYVYLFLCTVSTIHEVRDFWKMSCLSDDCNLYHYKPIAYTVFEGKR